ncbi:hypothetical protein [Egicoccus halophilus]|uniref:DUF4193 domain-containing protein n=1 Tax=Egicoccus halophilus TaxID=1670830 RepID=A0A8J3ADI0_9ACTN|nr:hypothetical protein [Egicoccus halophilus]GGI04717.1 hypothetical protein GCM10011354_10490 [Egicoccus halophilus]
MAARNGPSGDDDLLDEVGTDADEFDDEDGNGLADEFDDEDADEEATTDADDLGDESLEAAGEDLTVPGPTEESDEDEEEPASLPATVAFDDDEDEIVSAVAGDDDEGDEIDGVREGEFVCRSCYMAKLETQLADPERMLCRDCA